MKKEQEGIIIEITSHIAKIKVSRHGDCENCGACPGNNAMVLEANNEIGARKGDVVAFEMKEKNMLKAAFIVYVLPLILIFLGVQAGIIISGFIGMRNSALSIAGGIIAFLLSIALIVYYEKMSRTNKLPKIIKICSSHEKVA